MKFLHRFWVIGLFPLLFPTQAISQKTQIDWKSKYSYVGDFHDDCAVVRAHESDGGNLGVVNRNGMVILPTMYKQMSWKTNTLLEFVKNDVSENHVGLINSRGQLLFEPKFQSIGGFSRGFAQITDTQNLIGLINEEGKLLTPMIYAWVYQTESQPYIVLKQQKPGEKESAIYADTMGVKMGKLTFEDAYLFDSGIGIVKVKGKFGAVNEGISYIIPPQFDGIQQKSFGMLLVEKGNKCGVYRSDGKEIIPCKYQKCVVLGPNTFAVTLPSGKVGYQNAKKQWIIPPIYDAHISKMEGMTSLDESFLVLFNEKLGIIGESGEIIVPMEYEELVEAEYDPTHFYGIMVKKDGKYGMINRAGKEITPLIYDAYSYDFDGHGTCQIVLVKKDGLWGCLDTKSGKELIPPRFPRLSFIATDAPNEDSTTNFIIQHLKACEEVVVETLKNREQLDQKLESGLWELMDQKVDEFGQMTYFIQGGKNWKLLNHQGKVLNSNSYDCLRLYFHEGFLPFQRNARWGFVDSLGKEVIPPQFETPPGTIQGYFSNGRAWVTKGGESYYINTKGEKSENQDE